VIVGIEPVGYKDSRWRSDIPAATINNLAVAVVVPVVVAKVSVLKDVCLRSTEF
jgi:hypothetical protein